MPRKLTPRQVAARKARAMWPGFTPEGLERLREAAKARRPWEASTGPRTSGGKASSRLNAWRHGERSAPPPQVAALARALRRAERGLGPIPPAAQVELALLLLLAVPTVAALRREAALTSRWNRLRLAEVRRAWEAGALR